MVAEVYDGSSVEFKKDAIVSGMEKDVATRTARVMAGDKKALIGLPTGYDWLDDAMNGFQPGLYFIGARPSAGKTTMEGQIMERISMACGPVLRCTNDSNMETLMGRDASRRSGVSLPKVLSGHCGKTQRDRFFEALREVQKWPQDFIVGETNLRSLCSMIRTGKRRKGYVAVTSPILKSYVVATVPSVSLDKTVDEFPDCKTNVPSFIEPKYQVCPVVGVVFINRTAAAPVPPVGIPVPCDSIVASKRPRPATYNSTPVIGVPPMPTSVPLFKISLFATSTPVPL